MAPITDGVKIRAEIDKQLANGLLIINGGGAVALLAFLPSVLGDPKYQTFTLATLASLFIFQIGLVSAVLHNRYRRLCSLDYENAWERKEQPRPGSILGKSLVVSVNCWISTLLMRLSIALFLIGGLVVFAAGVVTVTGNQPSTQTTPVSASSPSTPRPAKKQAPN